MSSISLLLSVAVVVAVGVVVCLADMPCLSQQQEFTGVDPKHKGPSYFAVRFDTGDRTVWALRRQDGTRMIKVWQPNFPSVRFDIDANKKCTFKDTSKTTDFPQCVPSSATDQGSAWEFKDVDGASLFYSKDDPSKVLKKVSPDGNVTVMFSAWNTTISSKDVFNVPKNCPPA